MTIRDDPTMTAGELTAYLDQMQLDMGLSRVTEAELRQIAKFTVDGHNDLAWIVSILGGLGMICTEAARRLSERTPTGRSSLDEISESVRHYKANRE